MKRLLTGAFVTLFLFSMLLFPQRSFAAIGIFGGGGFLSAFRGVQTKVQRIHTRFIRLFGSREDEGLYARIEILPFEDDLDEWVIGASREVRWEYEDLAESVTKLYLVRDDSELEFDTERSLLVLLPARRGVLGSDDYEFDASYVNPGVYVIEVCNGDVCARSEKISFVLEKSENEEGSQEEL